jgi:hypothetical protein
MECQNMASSIRLIDCAYRSEGKPSVISRPTDLLFRRALSKRLCTLIVKKVEINLKNYLVLSRSSGEFAEDLPLLW